MKKHAQMLLLSKHYHNHGLSLKVYFLFSSVLHLQFILFNSITTSYTGNKVVLDVVLSAIHMLKCNIWLLKKAKTALAVKLLYITDLRYSLIHAGTTNYHRQLTYLAFPSYLLLFNSNTTIT